MPQLDILIFKYENFNFLVSFFFLFFFNQYYVFPILLRNVVIRRKLITRKVDSTDSIYFSLVFLKNFSYNAFDNIVFKITVDSLGNLVMSFFKSISLFLLFFCFFKQRIFGYYLNNIKQKANFILWNLLKISL